MSFLKPTLVYFSGKWSAPRDSRIGAATEKATVFLVAVRDTSCSSVCGCSVWPLSLVCMGKKTRFGGLLFGVGNHKGIQDGGKAQIL